MRYLFIVQGEGRGHMTQAIALSQILKEANHEVVKVIIGKSKNRKIPDFFRKKIQSPVIEINSPNFVIDKEFKAVKPFRTFIYSIWKSPLYKKSIDIIANEVEETSPDIIINFYDLLGGIYNFYKRPTARFICIAHQYLINHPEFIFPEGRILDRTSLKIANKITRLGAEKVLALSFQQFADYKKKKIYVVPPLLREEVKKHQIKSQESLLIYIVNAGYSKEIEKFHRLNPSIPIHCFWDKRGKPSELKIDDNLVFHQLDDTLFIEKMASCKCFATTAGFESVCEAMYFGKPALMIPVKGHYEQSCNAVDAEKAGAGLASDKFDLSVLINYLPDYKNVTAWFHDWVKSGNQMFTKLLT